LIIRGTSARLRDGIFGGIDGTVTTFAIVAGVQGAGLSAGVVVALGLANVIADGFSMAAGNYAGTKAVVDDRKRLREVEKRHIANNPAGEMAELREILARKGLHGDVLEQATEMISQDQDAWIGMMLAEEYDLPEAEEQPFSRDNHPFHRDHLRHLGACRQIPAPKSRHEPQFVKSREPQKPDE